MQIHTLDIAIIVAYLGIVARQYGTLWPAVAVLVLTSVLLKKNWYDRLESQ